MNRQDEAAVAVDAANARVDAANARAKVAVAEAHAEAKAAGVNLDRHKPSRNRLSPPLDTLGR